jgi:hypothetical protein
MVAHWRRVGGLHARRNMLINGVGATATAITLGIVLITKFTSGAWIAVLVVPVIVGFFGVVKNHYQRVERETACLVPLDVTDLRPPLVVVSIRRWDMLAYKGLCFALKISPEVYAVQICAEEDMEDLRPHWARYVEAPTRRAGLPSPQLVTIQSPYRRLFDPLYHYIMDLKRQHPDQQIAVIIPELVERHWWHYLLHNQQGELLKMFLLLHGDRQIVIINVPWYLTE